MNCPNNPQNNAALEALDTVLSADNLDSYDKYKPKGTRGLDDSIRSLSISKNHDSSRNVKESLEDTYSIESNSDKKLTLSDSDFFSKSKKKALDDSNKRLPFESDSTKKLTAESTRTSITERKTAIDKKPDLERRGSECRRRNSMNSSGKRSQLNCDGTNSSGSMIDSGQEIKNLVRRPTTRETPNISNDVASRSNSVTRRNSLIVSSTDDLKTQKPVITRINSKLNGFLKNMRWAEENDGSRARKLVKTMADFNLRYNMTKSIGKGTQGKIYMGESQIDSMPVVIKIIEETSIKSWNYIGKLPVSIFLLKILNNAEEDRSNPLFVKYIDHFHIDKTWVLVTENEGKEWIDMLVYLKKRKNPLSESEIMLIFSNIVKSLSDLQTLGFTHNDIKDSNILINSETLRVKLIDLDSCRQISSNLIPASEFAGTIFYASPEVRTGNFFSPELQEIYSLGILLLSIIFQSRFPDELERFVGSATEMLDPHILPKIFKDNKIELSSGLIKIIQCMLSRKPSKRPEISELLAFVNSD